METTKTSIQSICDEIARALSSSKDLVGVDLFLSSKNVGALLFLTHYVSTPMAGEMEEKIVELCEGVISELFEKANTSQLSFSSGLLGYAWLLNFLENEEKFEFPDSEFHGQIDAIAKDYAIAEIKDTGNYDFFHGGLGGAFYLLERHQKTDQSLALQQIFFAIKEKAKTSINGIFWPDLTDPKEKENCNLGVAHGLPSILYFLSRLVKANIEKTKVNELLTGGLKYLINCKNGTEQKSLFPSKYPPENTKNKSRLGWCYGDLGISLILYTIADAIEDDLLKQEAINTCLHSTQRTTFEDTKILDPGLCHGTAGASHLYHRMFLNTGRIEFQKAAKYWKEQTLLMANKTEGLAGFQLWNPATGWENNYGLLEGIAGIGLALITQEFGQNPSWDRLLLIS